MMCVVQHPRTKLYLAKRDRPRSEMSGVRIAGASGSFKWVRELSEAHTFRDEADAGLGAIFVRLDDPLILASGMPLRENNEDCSRPKAGSPTGEAGDAQGPSQ